MADLEARLELALDDALSGIGTLDERLGSAVTDFKTGLAEALNLLTEVSVTADAAPVTAAIDQAVAGADTTAPIEADTGDMTSQIDQAVGSVDATVTPDVAADAITQDIDEAIAGADTTITVEADTSQAEDALAGLDSTASEAGGGLSKLAAGSGDAAGGLNLVGPAAGFAAGEVGELTGVVGKFGPEAAGAAAATAGLVEIGKDFFDAALKQQTALERLNRTFGDTADDVQKIDVGGLNEDISSLALRTGSADEGLQNFAATFGQLGIDSGHAKTEVAQTTDEVIALATRASVLNPTLGSSDEIVGRLSTSLARGGRFLSQYGISLTSAEINARALTDTGKQSADQLTVYEKAAAGAAIATERLGDRLGKDISKGAQSDAIQVRRLGVELDEAKEAAGAGLVQPVTESMKALVPALTTTIRLLGEGLTGALRAVEPELKLVGTLGDLLGHTAGSGGGLGLFGAGIKNLAGQINPLHQVDQVISLTQGHFSDFAHGLPAIGVAFDVFDKGKSKAAQMADETKHLADEQNQQAHASLTSAVATGQLNRETEVAAIKQHTAKDGTIDWVGVLDQLQSTIVTTASKSDQFSAAVANQASAVKDATQLSQDMAQAQLGTLVATGQLTQAQLDHLAALNLTKQGTADYVAALQSVDPAAAKVAADQALIAGGLNSQAQQFTLAKDEAALYGEQFDQMVAPFLNAEKAQDDFDAKVNAALNIYQNASTAAKAYKDTISEIVDPVLEVNDANIKLQDTLDKTNKTLADNKGVVDERTKAGRDDEAAVIDLVKAYDTEIAALIASGDSSKTVATERQGEIDKLEDLKRHYPGLTQSVDEYVARLKIANTSGEDAQRVTEAHRKALQDIITSGDQWIQTLIATGTNETSIASARQEEIDKLVALKAQYPELGGVIDTYIAKLQGIPPTKETTISLDTIQAEVNAANIHTAIDELHDKGIAITVDSVQAQLNADATKSHIDHATEPVPPVVINADTGNASREVSSLEGQLRSLYGLSGGTVRIGVDIVPGVTGPLLPTRQAGGPIDPFTVVTVNEIGPEPIVLGQPGQVVSHSDAIRALQAGGGGQPQIDYNRLAVAIAAVRPNNVQINQVADNPDATAEAVAQRLGMASIR